MKKIKTLLTIIISIFIFSLGIDVFAASGSISVSSSSVQVGSPITVTVNISGAASWNVHVFVGETQLINEVDTTNNAQNTSKTWSATYTPTSEGSVTFTLSGNITGADDENDTNLSGSKTVTVTANNNNNNNNNGGGDNPTPSEVIPKPSGNNNNNNTNTNTNTDTKKDEKKEEKKSSNSKIKKLTVDDYELKKISDTKYELSVENNVNMITIGAEAEDSKAKVKGTGMHELVVGENKIEITVTAEDGSKNVITIVVTREESDTEEEPVAVTKVDNDITPPTSKFNIIPIIMTGLDIILAIAVVSVFIKNKKLKESINQMA